MDLKEIIESYKTLINHTELEKERSRERLKVCEQCDSRSDLWICMDCFCPLVPKSYSNREDPCPRHKWQAIY